MDRRLSSSSERSSHRRRILPGTQCPRTDIRAQYELIVNRDTTDYSINFGLNPTVHLGSNVLTFNSGIQGTIRRDSDLRCDEPEPLPGVYVLSTSSFFNAVSVDAYFIREAGPFTESNLIRGP